ncbi:MAG: phosphoserine aminotransferase [Lasallia pustulata]|uniref:phosphoserine transaminase n=1 Tax=Lasallia pustulata TaxID=136370 RepID=A0A5M8PED5_9LECA|nr:MAG: phosphoserine aminotransferase [Lasallia pustulata]
MPTREEVSYFGAGPAPLPTPVLTAGAAAFLNYNNTGLSLAEISHRSSTATKILNDTKAALTELLDIPDNYEILFMHGGGSGEFSAVVFNMVAVWVEQRRRAAEKECGGDEAKILERVRREVREHLRLDYLVTGSWSLKASQEAAQLLAPLGSNHVNIALDARKSHAGKFGTIPPPSSWTLTPTDPTSGPTPAFLYYCDNETVDGVEFPTHLTPSSPSSSPTYTTLVIIRRDLLTQQPPASFLHAVGIWSPPTILHWPTIAKNNSLYNTLPIFGVWIAGEVMRGLLAAYGDAKVAGQEEVSAEKARMVYEILDRNPEVYTVVPDKSVRSRMNICFRVGGGDAEMEKRFLEGAEERGLLGLKGHRSVGGIRASCYNAVSVESVRKLAVWLVDFAQPPIT